MITVTINGREVTVEDGTLILDAARRMGFDIPTFCYQARLSRLGSCRMCLVEIEGQKKLQPSCITPVMHGMVIRTDTPAIVSTRQAMLEFLLSNHALDCPVCDKGGECELQDMVMRHGPRKGRFSERKNRFHDKDYVLSPVIVKNSNRCVQCMRCVRVCSEVVGANALGAIGRGAWQEETSFLKRELDCDQCGNCIEVCPVGSFMRLPYRYKARPWDLKSAESVCTYCGNGCQLTIQSRDDEVVRVISKEDSGINNETLCARGRFGYDFVNNPERLKTPLVKDGEGFREASWEEALSIIVKRIKDYGGSTVGGIASSRLTNEELYLFQKFMRDVLDSKCMDSDCRWKRGAAAHYAAIMNLDRGGTSIYEALEADTLFIVGSSISEETPVTDYIIRRITSGKYTRMIISSPRRIKLNSSATLSLMTKPGFEGFLLAGVVKRVLDIVDKGKGDLNGAIRERYSNLFDAIKDSDITDITGITGDDMDSAARSLLSASSVSIMAGTDFLRYDTYMEGLGYLINILKALGKNVISFPLLDRCNQRGAWDMGVCPSLLPGYKPLERYEPIEPLDCEGMLEAILEGKLNALYIIGEDVVSLFPDREFAREALSKVEFLLVQDIFLTETAKMADIVLPGASFAEKDGTFTNQEGRVQRLHRLLAPPGNAMEDWRIIANIIKRMGVSFDFSAAGEIFDEIRNTVSLYSDIDYMGLNGDGELLKKMNGEKRGLDIIESHDMKECIGRRAGEQDLEFPLTLITGNHLFHSGHLSKYARTLVELLNEPFVEISSDDAETLGLKEGDEVSIEGRYFKAVTMVRIKEGSLKGIAFIPENFDSLPVNRFFKKGEGYPEVRISKVKGAGGRAIK